jgi:hypothetical protein
MDVRVAVCAASAPERLSSPGKEERDCAWAEPSRGLSAVTLAWPRLMPLSASTSRSRGSADSMVSRTMAVGRREDRARLVIAHG